MNGEELAFDGEFDAVFSNAALHWMKRADDVIGGVWHALRPGGRFVAECGGHECVATIVAALDRALTQRGVDSRIVNPWYFPTAETIPRGFAPGASWCDPSRCSRGRRLCRAT